MTDRDVLVDAVQALSLARDVATVQAVVRHAARRLANADGATFVLRDDDQCFYADEDAISPLWKGRRFPLTACISGWAMLHATPVAIPDIYLDDRIPHDAYRPTFVNSLVMVPIRRVDPLGAIGVYWADHHTATSDEVEALQALADSTSLAMETATLWQDLEARVLTRTASLVVANSQLSQEVVARRDAEREALRESLLDELTGLYNRRGFLRVASSVLTSLPRSAPVLVTFVDVDGLKQVNDQLGHAEGSALLADVATVLRSSFREGDVLGRIGGDEFAVLIPEPETDEDVRSRIAARLRELNGRRPAGHPVSLSLGFSHSADLGHDLDALLEASDADMYRERRHARTA